MTGRLAHRHLQLAQWSRGIAELSAAAGRPDFLLTLLASVKRLVDFDFIMAFAYQGPRTPLVLGDTLDPERHGVIAIDYAAGPFLLDPFFQLTLKGVNSGCYRLHEVAPDQFRCSEYFNLHYGRTGIGEEVGFFFDLGQGCTGVVSLSRWAHSSALVASEHAILSAVEPAVAAMCCRHWSALASVSPRQDKADEAMERFGRAQLSGREREIVTLILQGHSTESVALQLDISPGTVKIHRKNIYRKLAVSTQAELFAAFLGFVGDARRSGAYSLGDMAGALEKPHIFKKSAKIGGR